ncbi:MAG: site-2 protease family protein [Patescibacteria group bacterium]|jgi:membrane-associated protease RseP (regulator of RpoE activity)
MAMIVGFIGLFSLIFDMFSSSSAASPIPLVQADSGMIAMVGLGDAVHKGFLTYLCVVYYISVLLASMNLLPVFPLDGGNVVLETIKEAERKIDKEFFSIPFKIIKIAFQYAGFGFIVLLLMLMIWSDVLTVVKFFS